jgi:hypothetical protein
MTSGIEIGPNKYYSGLIEGAISNAQSSRQKDDTRLDSTVKNIASAKSTLDKIAPGEPPGGFTTAYKYTALYNKIDFSV